MYQLAAAGKVSMTELEEVIDLEQFFKLGSLCRMEKDIAVAAADKARQEAEQP